MAAFDFVVCDIDGEAVHVDEWEEHIADQHTNQQKGRES